MALQNLHPAWGLCSRGEQYFEGPVHPTTTGQEIRVPWGSYLKVSQEVSPELVVTFIKGAGNKHQFLKFLDTVN